MPPHTRIDHETFRPFWALVSVHRVCPVCTLSGARVRAMRAGRACNPSILGARDLDVLDVDGRLTRGQFCSFWSEATGRGRQAGEGQSRVYAGRGRPATQTPTRKAGAVGASDTSILPSGACGTVWGGCGPCLGQGGEGVCGGVKVNPLITRVTGQGQPPLVRPNRGERWPSALRVSSSSRALR